MIIREESVGCWRRECPFGLLGVIKGRKSCPAFPPLCLKAESHKAGPQSGVMSAPGPLLLRARARKK